MEEKWINYKEEIYKLRDNCYNCKLCILGQVLVDGKDPHVFSNGKVPSKILILGESPGATEVKKKIPLCGICGNYFDNEMLPLIGLTRKDIYVSNAVKCRPEKNRTPTDQEILICRPHLDAEINLIDPKLIITLGNPALWSVCNIRAITQNHGKIHQSREWSNKKVYNVFALYHPSFVIRSRGKKDIQENIKKDLIDLKQIIEEL